VRFIITLTRTEVYVVEGAPSEGEALVIAHDMWAADDTVPTEMDVTEDPSYPAAEPPDSCDCGECRHCARRR
jgi:hypothetical protein